MIATQYLGLCVYPDQDMYILKIFRLKNCKDVTRGVRCCSLPPELDANCNVLILNYTDYKQLENLTSSQWSCPQKFYIKENFTLYSDQYKRMTTTTTHPNQGVRI